MASLFGQSSAATFGYGRRQLGDRLVGPVCSHDSVDRRGRLAKSNQRDFESWQTINVSPIPEETHERDCFQREIHRVLVLRGTDATRSTKVPTANTVAPDSKQLKTATLSSKPKRMKANYKTPARRLEQCRANQTRYRKKQKEYLLQLENNAENLRRELDDLRSRRQDIEAQAINEQSPWNVVADVFRLLDVSFRSPWCISNKEDANNRAKVKGVLAMIKNGFAQDVSMGDLTGVGALLDQVQRYSRFFGEPRIRLKKMEQEVPGVLLATSNLRLTITEYTLRCVFPYLETVSRSKYDTRPSVGARLIGQQLHCSCSMRFYFGDETGRVVKVDTSIDWITPLVQALGNLEEVSQVFDSALINSECLLGGHSKHSN